MIRVLAIMCCELVVSLLSAHAQINPESKNSFTLFGTTTVANSTFYAQATNQRLFETGATYNRILARSTHVVFSYSPEIVPLAILRQPQASVVVVASGSPVPDVLQSSHTAYGAGATPVNFELAALPLRRIQPFVGAGGGFLYFNKNVPSFQAAQFNFTAQGKLGINVRLQGDSALSFAYVFHHLSNADEASTNPGLDSQMVYVGFRFGNFRVHWH